MNWEEWAATHQTRHHAKLEDWAIDFLKKLPVLYVVKESGVSRTRLYYILRGGGPATVKDIGIRFNVWNIPPVQSSLERTGHPAQFPLRLVRDHLVSWSDEGDVVMDPFMGSGTTGEACIQTKRKFIGVEINPDYFQIAEARIQKAVDNFQNVIDFSKDYATT